MALETIVLIISGTFISVLFSMIYIYNEVVLPTLKEYDEDAEWKFLGSNQMKQIHMFCRVSKEKNIHKNVRLYTQFSQYLLPALLLAFISLALLDMNK